MPSRWDFVYDRKPVALEEHLLDEAAKVIAAELSSWPPPVSEWNLPGDEARFSRLLEPGSRRPDPRAFTAAFHLARLELSREVLQIDGFMRNERWREFTDAGDGYEGMILISRYLTEQMLALGEATEGRLERAKLVSCLTQTERRFLSAVSAEGNRR
jgi:hypothetical protein